MMKVQPLQSGGEGSDEVDVSMILANLMICVGGVMKVCRRRG